MARDPKYDILFEPMRIGPVTAKNRFYQVPHCNGGGYRDPSAAAEHRRVKAQGGWGTIFTEQVEMHHTSEITPFIELRLWDGRIGRWLSPDPAKQYHSPYLTCAARFDEQF